VLPANGCLCFAVKQREWSFLLAACASGVLPRYYQACVSLLQARKGEVHVAYTGTKNHPRLHWSAR
jgi:hypothetical protein